jgi:hypothetical protein
MAKNDPRRHFQQALGFDGGSCRLVDSEVLRGAPQKNGIARWLGGREQE